MWLPTIEERDLLAYYYKEIGKPNEWETLSFCQLTVSVGYFKCIRDIVSRLMYWLKDRGVKFIKLGKEPIVDKVWAANERLQERGFIELRESHSVVDAMTDRLEVKLTLQGWDIGRKYSNCLIRSGLWFEEYKHHWLWIIVAYIAGVLSTFIANRL